MNRNSIDDLIEWYNEHTLTYYGVVKDESDKEVNLINPLLKRPQNEHKQQYALLESTGVIDYLKQKYSGISDVKLADLISNILNRNAQNTREMLSLNEYMGVFREPKIKTFLSNLSVKIGIDL